MIKKITLIVILSLFAFSSVFADVYVKPHYKSNGTYVGGHYRSSPDSTTSNNWSTIGNTNPYTGKPGTNYNRSGSLGGSCSALSLNC